LTRREFATAGTEFRASYRLRFNWKLPLVLTALRFAPEMLLRVYLSRRVYLRPGVEKFKRALAVLVSGLLLI
jgi:hypothetical protein